MGNSNGSVVEIYNKSDNEKRLVVILNMPTDALNLPDTEKTVAYLYYQDTTLDINDKVLF